MSKQEIKIITKIIREVTLYLMMHGFKDFIFESKNTAKTTQLIITLDDTKPDFIEAMQTKMNRERQMEIETYGWELIGDIDQKNELEIISLLIDSMDVEYTQSKTIITLTRTNKYL